MTIRTSVTVIIPAFNSAPTIRRAIDSAIAQTYVPSEILVVDDCSNDETADVVKSYADRGVRLILLTQHKGAGGARNAGIEAAASEVIAFLDSDDEWLNGKLEAQVEILESSSRISLVACGANLISEAGADLGDIYRGHPVVTGSQAWKALLAFNFIATPTVIAWRKNLIGLGGFNEVLKIGEDQDLWIRLALTGDLGYVPRSFVRVHVRENSLSAWELSDQLIYTIPMIQRHVRSLHDRLSKSDLRRILGERFGRLGRVAYARGALRTGLSLIVRSILLGYRPLESLYFLASAAPPAIWLRRQLGVGTVS
ncbi:MAG TPA: glycosyltransferase family 2 protein [Rhizomicrobium sp.]|jgi:glycosyltransferase involved in cell wall biosynthesis|nr:glycosyltransferase family 2 protein [Rhizomicrobium sp.]